jgi:hypothetical protein
MRRLLSALVVAACLTIPSAVFLARYLEADARVAPAGSDTPQHVWRSNVVAELGLRALPAYAGSAQALNTNADRPGLPILLSILSSVTGAEPRDLVYVLPAAAAAAIAMAAAALAGSLPWMPWWGIALAGVAAGASVQVALAANGYLDELLVLPLVAGAAGAALRAAAGGPGRALGALCLLAAWLVHWQFAAVFTGLLVVLALGCVTSSIRERRDGRPLLETASARVVVTAGSGAGFGLAALLVGASGGLRLPTGLVRGSVERHLAEQVSLYRFPSGAAAAGVGAVALASDRDPHARRAAWLLVPWALLPAAAALLYLIGRTVPVQRSLSFAIAIPLLGAIGGVAVARWLSERSRIAAAVVAIVIALAVTGSVALAWTAWRTREPWSPDRRLAEFQALGRYLTGAGRPAVIVVDRTSGHGGRSDEHFGTVPVLRRIRAELPARLALRTTVYLGDPDRLLAGEPTITGSSTFDRLSRETWRSVRPLLRGDPVIVILRSQFRDFDRAVHAHPAWGTVGWAAIVAGPSPSAALERPRVPDLPASGELILRWAASLAVITLAGVGWTARLAGGSPAMRIATAPATGLALIVIAGLVAERIAVRTGEAGGIVTVLAVVLLGVAAAVTGPPGTLADGPAERRV